jgi:CubicO group peptidase (beta-lactamase class C family)
MRLLASPLLALVLAAPTTWTQTLGIRPAVELVIHSPAQTAYSLESSRDLQSWQPLQSATLGTGQPTQILVASSDTGSAAAFFRITTNRVRDLNALLEPIRAANKVPAVACAVVLSNRIAGIGAVGLRKFGVPSSPVTLEDKWHHGSLTKSMTATLAAILVREGRVQWQSTLADVFPDWAPRMNAAWRAVTLEQLTSNRGGAPGDLSASGIWTLLWNFVGTPRESRRLLLERLTVLAPSSPPGTQYEYSNAGFALAGHMLETVMDQPWEELMTIRLFEPLGMASAGFGVPATPRYINQPWGHQVANGQPAPHRTRPQRRQPSRHRARRHRPLQHPGPCQVRRLPYPRPPQRPPPPARVRPRQASHRLPRQFQLRPRLERNPTGLGEPRQCLHTQRIQQPVVLRHLVRAQPASSPPSPSAISAPPPPPTPPDRPPTRSWRR